jgi:predicted ATPase/DNA-binding winged helix-turn-helix (wHTH) protein
MMMTAGQPKDALAFGPFSLAISERLLTRNGAPVELGARALEILIVLISSPNEIVSKSELMSRVWPDVSVEEGSLRFHMAGLRKALGDGKAGARYITTIAGRGYCFVAPVSRSGAIQQDAPAAAASFPHANVPNRLSRMIGRDQDVPMLSARLMASRFVTIVGAGGIGKTTVAVAVAHHLTDAFSGSVLFVDLGAVNDLNLVSSAIASMLGVSVQSSDPTPGLIAYLRDKRILLVLDTCEHLVEATAALAASVVQAAPEVHILATSREALRADGEEVYRLDALALPPEGSVATAADIQMFPATQLFVERAMASGAQLEITNADAPIIANICRKLDGMALAIELAARRVESYGLEQTSTLLDQRLTLLWQGSRAAPPRQKTLQATLDWSYELLSQLERTVLCRLAVFVGHFTIDAAVEVITTATLDRATVFTAIDSLVAKSMVAVRPVGAMMHYRLLDTTRAYALDIRLDDGSKADLAARHACYHRRWLEQAGGEWSTLSTGLERIPHFAALNNARAALEWSFSAEGNVKIGIRLAAAAAPVFLTMSLLPECFRWSETALRALNEKFSGGVEEMHLQACLGTSSMHMRGESEAALTALKTGVAIAEARKDGLNQAGLLGILHNFHFRGGDFNSALRYAEQCQVVAKGVSSPAAVALAHSILGRTLHYMGDLEGARSELDALMQVWPASRRNSTIYLGYDRHYRAAIHLARNLWLQGYPAQAVARARQTVSEAEAMDHPTSLVVVLAMAASVFFWVGDLQSAERHIDASMAHAESNSLAPLVAVGQARRAELAIRRGQVRDGIRDLRAALEKIHTFRYGLLTSEFNISLTEGLKASGQLPEALIFADESIRRAEQNGDVSYLPELLRTKANVFRMAPEQNPAEAEDCLMQSLELSRRQGARAWELRAATDLAELWAEQRRRDDAHGLLRPVFEHFVDGLDTSDVKAARGLLSTLR